MRGIALTVLGAPLALVALLSWAGAGEGTGQKARKLIEDLEATRAAPALSGAHDGGAKPSLEAAEKPIAEARKLLARADELRRLGDVPRAELAEEAALEWAEAARDIVKAVALEKGAADDEEKAASATTKAQKARAALDEAIARRAKLQAELDTLDQELAQKALDGGTPDAAKPKKSKGPKP